MLIAVLTEGSVPLSVQYSGRHMFHWKLMMLKTELAAAGTTGKIQFGPAPGDMAQVITPACLAVVDRTVDRTAAWLLPAVNTVAPARARATPLPIIRFLNPITGLSPSVRPPRKLKVPRGPVSGGICHESSSMRVLIVRPPHNAV